MSTESEIQHTVALDPVDTKALKKLHDSQQGVAQFVDMVTKQGEMRLQQVQEEGRDIWAKIAKKYNLDLEKCAYTLSNDGTSLVLTGVRYSYSK